MNAPVEIPLAPPSSTEPAARAHRRVLEAELEQLKASVPAVLHARMMREPGSAKKLSELRDRIRDLEYEIDRFPDLLELIRDKDAAAVRAWRTDVHCLPIDEALHGLGKDSCCSRSQHGLPGGCLFTGGDISVADCLHPLIGLRMGRFHRYEGDERYVFPLRHVPRAAELFSEACRRLKVQDRFK